ncbi:MAG: transglycosylase SLT domain-containing protein [Myxococcota bacterium]
MSRRSARSDLAQRGRLSLLLLPVSLFLVGGSPLGLENTARVSSGTTPVSVDRAGLVRILEWENPLLPTSQRVRIAEAVLRYSAKYALDPELVTAVLLVESGARPWARSERGAMGLMQVMPHMMSPLGLVGNGATVESNVEAGCWILADNIRRLGEERGVSAYFWGSRIRGEFYLERVREARAALREFLRS